MKRWGALLLFVLSLLGLNFMSASFERNRASDHSVNWRQVAASLAWIQGYDAWRDQDSRRLLDCYGIAVGLEPHNLLYWRLAAQTIAADLPRWEIKARENHGTVLSDEETHEIEHRFGEKALVFLEQGSSYFDTDPQWYLTNAFIAEAYCMDEVKALSFLEQAVSLPDFPQAAGWSYARLLIARQEWENAQAFLESWQSAVDDPAGEIGHWLEAVKEKIKSASEHETR